MEILDAGMEPVLVLGIWIVVGLVIGGIVNYLLEFEGGPFIVFAIVGLIAGLVIAGVSNKHFYDDTEAHFESYYDVRVVEGDLPLSEDSRNPEVTLELFFEEDKVILDCLVQIEDGHYSGFCEDGRAL